MYPASSVFSCDSCVLLCFLCSLWCTANHVFYCVSCALCFAASLCSLLAVYHVFSMCYIKSTVMAKHGTQKNTEDIGDILS